MSLFHYRPNEFSSHLIKLYTMDPPAVLSAPSLKLTMVSSTEHPSSVWSRNGSQGQGSISHSAEVQSSRELLYDQLCNMIAQEERDGYKCCDYLRYYSPQSEKPKASKNIDEGCRASICGWMYRVADHFSIDREGELVISSCHKYFPLHIS